MTKSVLQTLRDKSNSWRGKKSYNASSLALSTESRITSRMRADLISRKFDRSSFPKFDELFGIKSNVQGEGKTLFP